MSRHVRCWLPRPDNRPRYCAILHYLHTPLLSGRYARLCIITPGQPSSAVLLPRAKWSSLDWRSKIMTSQTNKGEDERKKVMVPRKKLQSVSDLLANGVNEEGERWRYWWCVSYSEFYQCQMSSLFSPLLISLFWKTRHHRSRWLPRRHGWHFYSFCFTFRLKSSSD